LALAWNFDQVVFRLDSTLDGFRDDFAAFAIELYCRSSLRVHLASIDFARAVSLANLVYRFAIQRRQFDKHVGYFSALAHKKSRGNKPQQPAGGLPFKRVIPVMNMRFDSRFHSVFSLILFESDRHNQRIKDERFERARSRNRISTSERE